MDRLGTAGSSYPAGTRLRQFVWTGRILPSGADQALQEPAIRHSQLAHWLEHNFSVELGPEVSFIAYCLALIGMVLNRRKGLFAVMALVTKASGSRIVQVRRMERTTSRALPLAV